MEITATVRLSEAAGAPVCETRRFDALASGLSALAGWLASHRVEAASMEATGAYWEAPFDALADAGIEVQLLNAQQVRQLHGRKTDIEDSRCLARVCQFGLGTPSFVPARELRALCRHRRTLVAQRSRARNRAAKVIDRSGARIGGVITDIFGMNGRRILDGLVDRLDREAILGSLSRHVRGKLERLGDALTMSLRDADRVVLADLLDEHDDLDRRIADLDRHLDQGMAGHDRRLRLLETIPGIDRVSAIAILVRPARMRSPCSAPPGAWPPGPGLPGQPRERRQAKGRPHPTRRQAPAHDPDRLRPRRRPHPELPVPQLPQGPARAARLQARHRGDGAQARASRLRRAARRPALPRPGGREALVVKRNAPRWLAQLAEFGILEPREDGTLAVNWAKA